MRLKVTIIPLVKASGTGKVSSTVNAYATGDIGITKKPIANIVIDSNIEFTVGKDMK